MKRAFLIFALFASFALTVPAQAATQAVSIVDNGFSPSTKAAARGDKVAWTNTGYQQHTSTGDVPLSYWASTKLSHGGSFTSPVLAAAGTYPYHCAVHTFMKGKVTVPLKLVWNGSKILITLASAPADASHKYVLQRKVGSGWQTVGAYTTAATTFSPTLAGTYTFRAALQKNGTTATAAFFSPPKSVEAN